MNVIAEIRNWFTLALAVIGGFITIRTFISNQRQRRLENIFRLITVFKESLHEEDIQAWQNIFHACSEPAGAKEGFLVEYIDCQRLQRPLSALFSEGPPDNGAIERMAELFDLISSEAVKETIELRIVYFQLGQLMDTIHSWLRKIDNPYGKESFLEKNYPYFDILYKKKLINRKWAKRTYTHIG